MINRVVLVGRLTRDPELRYTPNGVAVANFGIAVNRPFTNQQGEREADFLNCVTWRKQAENVANFLKKGSLAGVDGRLQSRSYDNQDGKRVYVVKYRPKAFSFLNLKMQAAVLKARETMAEETAAASRAMGSRIKIKAHLI
ncbi:single-stranded DNA-binding protein [Sinobaca sp. H24]|uniref:single-stranded DNA-binding protein n=1 Tax=Sinobaca sp. H24 TaxID=2923376 RepID=UPI00207ACE54|nr:single-stranded DNA-binding protein [Sinobaca sp. H24]